MTQIPALELKRKEVSVGQCARRGRCRRVFILHGGSGSGERPREYSKMLQSAFGSIPSSVHMC